MARQIDKSKLVRVDRPVVAQPPVPAQGPISVSSYTAPLANQLQTTTDDLSQLYGNNLPVTRHAPLPPAANPVANASINSAAQTIAEQVVATNVSIGLNAPPEITVRGSRADAQGTFNLSWTPEEANYFFAGPLPINPSPVSSVDTVASSLGNSDTVSTTVQPSVGRGEWALWIAEQYGGAFTLNKPAGWSYLFDPSNPPATAMFGMPLISDAPVIGTIEADGGSSAAWASFITVFGSQPTFIQNNNGGISGGTPVSISFNADVTPGNSILVIMGCQMGFIGANPPNPGSDGLPATFNVTDTQGDKFQMFAQAFNSNGFMPGTIFDKFGAQCNGFIAQGVVGGSTTITVVANTDFDHGSIVLGNAYIFEVTPMDAIFGTPAFRKIFGQPIGAWGDLPLPTFTNIGGVAAIAPVSHEWVTSINFDGSISLAQPGFIDISGVAAPAQLPAATNTTQGAIVLTGDLGNTAASPEVVSTHLTSPLPINQGGTGTTTPSLVAGTDIAIAGSWPNQTVSWVAPPSILPAAMTVNGSGVSADKLVYINGVQDGSLLWQVKINGTLDGG